MSISSPYHLDQSLPVGVIAEPVESVLLSPERLTSQRAWDDLMALVHCQGVLPLVSSSNYLEGLLIENHLLSQTVYADTDTHGLRQLNTQVLLNEARRYQLSLNVQQTLQDAQTILFKTNLPYIPIVDQDGRYTGTCASRGLLIQILSQRLKPPRIGGLATPLGVYLTSGLYSGGAGWQGLVAQGVLLAVLIQVLEYAFMAFYSAAYAVFPAVFQSAARPVGDVLSITLEYGFFTIALLLLLRLSPLAGLHAAEHMTVHAIENGVDLTPTQVSVEPRVHQRCGTNLMVWLLGVQLAVSYLWVLRPYLSLWTELAYLAGWVAILLRWGRPLGSWLQEEFTTKSPTPAQLESGIKAGQELLEKFRKQPHGVVRWYQRLWGGGLIQVGATFIAVHSLLSWLLSLLGR